MFETNISPYDPFSLILSQDKIEDNNNGELGNVWEIQFDRGELGGISLYSTLSMRALGIRITPIFSNKHENRINLSQFFRKPVITSLTTSYAKISCEIFQEIDMDLEYWVVNGKTICGVVTITNNSKVKFDGDLQYIVNLKPLTGGEFVSGVESQRNFYLTGKTESIAPVFSLSGNPQQGKFGNTSIESHYSVKTNDVHKLEWCLSSFQEFQDSVEAIKNVPFDHFEKETTRIQLSNLSNIFYIESGNSDWDKTFYSSQKSCHQLIKHDPSKEQTFFFNRINPENIISLSNQITPLQLWYFCQVIPNQLPLIEKQLLTFFSAQNEDGFIPNHLSQEDPQSKFHAFPILAKLTYEIYVQKEDYGATHQIINHLVAYIKKWLSNQSPYWESALQSFYEDLPIYNIFQDKTSPIHSRWVGSPFLNTLIHQEISYCLKLLELFSDKSPEHEWLEEQKEFLFKQIQDSWNPKLGIFRYRDAFSKKTPRKKKILSINKAGNFPLDINLDFSKRLSISISMEKGISRNIEIRITGFHDNQELTEVISTRQISWGNHFGFATTTNIFEKITLIEITHFPNSNRLEIFTSDFSQNDLTCCYPIAVKEIQNQKIEKMVSIWLEEEFSSKHGLPLVPKKHQSNEDENQNYVDLPLVTLILEGLINAGYQELAFNLFERIMNTITDNLRIYKTFFRLFDADDGSCKGEYNIINGMVPLKVYFNLLGIRHWYENEIELTGNNLIKETVSIQFRGTKLICSKDGYTFFTSAGKSLELKENKIYKIKIPN